MDKSLVGLAIGLNVLVPVSSLADFREQGSRGSSRTMSLTIPNSRGNGVAAVH